MDSNCVCCGDITISASLSYRLELKPHWSDCRAVLPKQSSTNLQLCSPGASAAAACGGVRAQYANEPVAAPEFRTDEIAVRAKRFAQR
jgi:hypothetical protein